MAAGVDHDDVGADGARGGQLRGEDPCRPFAVFRESGGEVNEVLRVDGDRAKSHLPHPLNKEIRVQARRGLRPSLGVANTSQIVMLAAAAVFSARVGIVRRGAARHP